VTNGVYGHGINEERTIEIPAIELGVTGTVTGKGYFDHDFYIQKNPYIMYEM
jgi:hypothetical protein